MDNETQLNELEARIARLENPTTLNAEQTKAINDAGFIKYVRGLVITNAGGLEFPYLYVEIKGQPYWIGTDLGAKFKLWTIGKNPTYLYTSNLLNDGMRVSVHNASPLGELSTSTLPGGLADGIPYYVVDSRPESFAVSLTSGGTPITMTNGGVGTFYWSNY